MAEDFKALIEEQKRTTAALLKGEQRAETDADTTAKQHEDKIKSDTRIEAGRKAWQTRQANKELTAGGAADKEDAQEKAAADQKTQNLLGKIAGGVTGMFGKMMAPVKGAGKGIMAMLKGTLVAGLLLAVLAFLESKYWTDTKDFIVNKVVPMLVDFYENILKPIGVIFADFFIATWKNIKELFSGLGEAFDLFANGEWWEGIKTIFTSIGTFLGDLLDNLFTSVYNTIAVIFGLSKTDSVFGSIWGFFTDTYDEIVSWISITWFNIKTTISTTWTNIKDSVVKVFTDVKDWFVGLWTWASDVAVGTWTSVKDWMQGVWDGVWGWFSKAWTWASDVAVGTWTNLKDYMQGVWDGVWGWFTKAWTWASDVAVGTWTTVTNFITGVWDSVVGWFKGLWTWGKAAGATEEGGFSLTKFVDAAFLKVKNWVLSIFKWGTEPVGPNDSWIAKTIKDTIALVKTWALSLFAWAETPGGSWISIKVKEVIKLVKEWVTGLFTWASEAGKVDGKEWSLTTMIGAAVANVIGWVKGLFTWAVEKGKTPDGEEWSLIKMISGVFKSAKDWFVGLFTWKKAEPKEGEKEFSVAQLLLDLWEDIKTALSSIFPSLSDLKELLPSFSDVKDTVKGWFGFGGSSKDKDKDKAKEDKKVKPAAQRLNSRGFPVNEDKDKYAELRKVTKQDLRDSVKFGISPELVARERARAAKIMDETMAENAAYRKKLAAEQKAEVIQTAGIKRTGRAATAPAVVNAPVNSISNSQTNTNIGSTPMVNPNPMVTAANAAR